MAKKQGRTDRTNQKADRTAHEAAYAYLASRMRTVAEVEKHLSSLGYSSEEVQETINDLIGLRYLDDYQYALRYFEYNREKRRGTLRAARELAEKGIDAETVRNAKEDFLYMSGTDEFEDALAVAEKELRLKTSGLEDELPELDDRLAAMIARRLENRGYSRDIIFKVIDRLRSD
ncbi:MAG: regulatory protein RecX [Mogibacterium sp.]|nr:regulatory protein RecX [Mogibacterium sp.]